MVNKYKIILLLGCFCLVALALFMGMVFERHNSFYSAHYFGQNTLTDTFTPPACDIYPDTGEYHMGLPDDWCQKYIDYGYNQGLAMMGRMYGEWKMLKALQSDWSDSVVEKDFNFEENINELYDQAQAWSYANSNPFKTKNRKY